jgi:hypothetical protein
MSLDLATPLDWLILAKPLTAIQREERLKEKELEVEVRAFLAN